MASSAAGLGPSEEAEDLKSARKANDWHDAANSAKLTRCKFDWLHRRCIVMSLPMQHVVFGHTADTADFDLLQIQQVRFGPATGVADLRPTTNNVLGLNLMRKKVDLKFVIRDSQSELFTLYFNCL